MRGFALANARHTTFGIVSLIGAALLGFVAAGATLLLGFTAPAAGGADQIALVLTTWAAGRIGFAAFSGTDPALPLDFFRTLPLPRRGFARALLILGIADPSLYFLAIASGSLVAFGFRQSAAAGVIGVLGALILLAFISVLSTIVAALVPAGSRRRQDAGTLLAAVLISAVFVTSTLTPALLTALGTGSAVVLAILLRTLPSGWASDAIALQASGNPIWVIAVLVGFVLVCGVLIWWWPSVLTRRLESAGGGGHRHRTKAGRRILPASATGAVASRELRLWIRDPTRAGFMLIALVVGLGVCIVPLISQGAAVLLPFAGLGTIVIAAAVAGNSYGFDGPALGLVLTTPNVEAADVRGRQLAWFLLVGPYSILLSLVGVVVAGTAGEWAWVLGLLPAVLGGAVGVFVLVSAVAPQPLDDTGGPTPSWTLKVYATLILTCVSSAPALALLIVGAATGAGWVSWLALPIGIVTGVICTFGLGSLATKQLVRRGPEMLEALASSPAGRR
jgi:ABC-2 type transport system permease protein